MSVALLDINDSNLQLWQGETHLQSPGYGLLEGREYRFGNTARAAARLRPRDVATRYWWQLGTQPLQPALGPARHNADLVHAHLLHLHREAGEPEAVLLAVPGSMEREQLALLLGIIEACPFEAVGLVNRSVALVQPVPAGTPLFHLEFQLHQALLSELHDSGGERRLFRVLPLPGCGLLQLQERLIEIIAATFIRQTRFDPRRKATTEQQLYDALPAALEELQRAGEANLEISGYNARLNGAALHEAGQRLFSSVKEITDSNAHRLLADPLAGLLPGIRQALPGMEVLKPDQLPRVQAILEAELLQGGSELTLVTVLPCSPGKAAPAAQASSSAGAEPLEPSSPQQPAPVPAAHSNSTPATGPTHLLQGFKASPLVAAGSDIGAGWQLYREGSHWLLRGPSSTSATVNGQTYSSGRSIQCGDTLAVAGALAGVVIEVSDAG